MIGYTSSLEILLFTIFLKTVHFYFVLSELINLNESKRNIRRKKKFSHLYRAIRLKYDWFGYIKLIQPKIAHILVISLNLFFKDLDNFKVIFKPSLKSIFPTKTKVFLIIQLLIYQNKSIFLLFRWSSCVYFCGLVIFWCVYSWT